MTTPQNSFDDDFKKMVASVLTYGETRGDRTGTGTVSIFGGALYHNLAQGFPALTLKKLPFKVMAAELACFVKGLTDIREFQKRGCNIWNENLEAYNEAHGCGGYDLGPVYGSQWRNFAGANIDQMRNAISMAKAAPHSRRMVVSAWNPADEDEMVLPPCHTHWQISVRDRPEAWQKTLDLIFYMRSVDVMLGFPFDIASYALLNHLIARECGLLPGRVIAFLADTHIYLNHVDGAQLCLEREPRWAPRLRWNEEVIADAVAKNPMGFRVEDFEPEWVDLEGYDPHPIIPLKMAV